MSDELNSLRDLAQKVATMPHVYGDLDLVAMRDQARSILGIERTPLGDSIERVQRQVGRLFRSRLTGSTARLLAVDGIRGVTMKHTGGKTTRQNWKTFGLWREFGT